MPITEADLDDLLTIEQAAKFYRCSRATINRMIAGRELDVVRIGSGRGRPRITKRSLLDHLNRNVTVAAKEKRAPRSA